MDIVIACLMASPFIAYGFLACVVEQKKRKKKKLEQESNIGV